MEIFMIIIWVAAMLGWLYGAVSGNLDSFAIRIMARIAMILVAINCLEKVIELINKVN